MEISSEKRGRVDAALGALVADGIFCLAFTFHLLSSPAASLSAADFLAMGIIICVLVITCAVIHHEHWRGQAEPGASVKRLRIRELQKGAALEFDGQHYRIDDISRSRGEIRIARVGRPGSIIVQIEGQV